MTLVSTVQVKKRIPVLQLIKTIVAALVSWYGAVLIFQGQAPIFATIAAIIVVQPSVNQSLGKALERSLGTILGVAIALGASLAFGSPNWLIVLAVVAALVLGWAFKFTPATANQIAISAMLVIAIGAATPEYATARILETVFGAVLGIVINAIIVPPVDIEPSKIAVSELGTDIAQILEDTGSVLRRTTSHEVLEDIYLRSRALRQKLNGAQKLLNNAYESLRFNARKSKHTKILDAELELLNQLAVLVNRVIGISRAVRDNYDDTVIKEPHIREIANELMKAGHDLRLRVRDAGLPPAGTPHPATNELPALTSPIDLSPPSGKNWILIGFLMENLTLVRSEIIGKDED